MEREQDEREIKVTMRACITPVGDSGPTHEEKLFTVPLSVPAPEAIYAVSGVSGVDMIEALYPYLSDRLMVVQDAVRLGVVDGDGTELVRFDREPLAQYDYTEPGHLTDGAFLLDDSDLVNLTIVSATF